MTARTRLRDKAERYGWFGAALAALREETDAALASGVGVPEEPGGWWHQYVCPTHGAELLFDPRESAASAFRCPRGCLLEGEAYRGAWLVFKHQERARTALSAAALYAATGEARYAAAANALLEAYARRYPAYPVHPDAQPWMLKGRAFHQALTEAIWATTMLRAYLLLRDEGALRVDESAAAVFFDLLTDSMTEYRRILIEERDEPANNYTAWLNACLACLYAARDDRAGMEALVDARGGLRHHLDLAVLPDHLEFEGSTYYHIFVLRAYGIAAEMAERLGFEALAWTGGAG
ncbi:MAG TPA: alginate lyase family protein, partial [Paenibacillus sp.]|nr:alginate lyase family protein [Paenibacillus sp.]